jgi:hypothetical protein
MRNVIDIKDSDSGLLKLPDELQLIILKYVGWPDMRTLQQTCVYYRNIITPSMLLAARVSHASAQFKMEKNRPNSSKTTLVCSACLSFVPRREILVEHPLALKARGFCYKCSVKYGQFAYGTQVLIPANDPKLTEEQNKQKIDNSPNGFCGHCQRWNFVRDGSMINVTNAAEQRRRIIWCKKCSNAYHRVHGKFRLLRLWQTVFAIVTLGLSCSGTS